MPSPKQPQDRSGPEEDRPKPEKSDGRSPTPDFSDLPPEKQDLAEKLANVGVWAGRIAGVLSRFSRTRIEANFELYRRRAAEQVIRNPGAWLHEAITEGYALPGAESASKKTPEDSSSPGEPGLGPAPDHKEIVSETEKEAYVARGIAANRFHRCLSSEASSPEPQFMYFAPEEGGPERRV